MQRYWTVIRLGTRLLWRSKSALCFLTPEELETFGEITLCKADKLTGYPNEVWWKLVTQVFHHLFIIQFNIVPIRHVFVQVQSRFRSSCVCLGSYHVFLQECLLKWISLSYTRVSSTDQNILNQGVLALMTRVRSASLHMHLGWFSRPAWNIVIQWMNLLTQGTLDTSNLIDDMYHCWWLTFCSGIVLETSFNKIDLNKCTYSFKHVLQKTSTPFLSSSVVQ